MGKAKKVLISAFLLASCVIVQRLLAIRLPFISIDFKFIPFMFSAILLGTKYATVIGITSDIVGRLMFPMSAYHPGFTLSAGLTGYLYGKFLYKNGRIEADKKFLIRLILCVVTVTLVVNVCLTTVWVMQMTDKAANIILPIRFVKQAVMVPVQIVVMYLLTNKMQDSINSVKGNVRNDLFKEC